MRPIATILTLLALALLTVLFSVSGVVAQEQEPAGTTSLASTNPAANAVLPESPDRVAITFSREIEPHSATVRLIDRSGQPIDIARVDQPAPDTISLDLASPLPHGSYLVSWRIAQAEAGSPVSGFYGFTVGTDQDVAPVTIPDTGFRNDDAPRWMSISAFGMLLVGLAVLAAAWPFWRAVLYPLMPTPAEAPRRLRLLVAGGAIVAMIAAMLLIVLDGWNNDHGAFLDRVFTAVRTSDTAHVLLVTIALVSLHSIVLASVDWSNSPRSGGLRLAPWLTSLALTVPGALLSHAADEPAGRTVAITVVWLALLALSLWIGSLLALATLPASGRIIPRSRRVMVTFLSIAVVTVAITGAYAGWLFIGNGAALTSTDYGTLAFACCLLAGLLVLASVGCVLFAAISPVVLTASVIGMATLIAIGGLMATDTARASLTRETTQRETPFELDGDNAQLILAPGAAGVNHVRLEIDRASIPLQTTATLTMSLPAQPELGSVTVPLSRVNGDAFEHHGTELVVADRWDLTVTLTEPGQSPVTATFPLLLDAQATTVNLPDVPWRFKSSGGVAGWFLLVIGIAGVGVGIAMGKSRVRWESAGIGAMALVLGLIMLSQARLDPILAAGGGDNAIDPGNLAMITRGEEIYRANCLSCHGADLRGDGPASSGMQPPPADFSAPHTMVHDDATLIYWLRHGKQGTAMPPFGDVLSDQEIRDVLSYIERQQQGFADPQSTPSP